MLVVCRLRKQDSETKMKETVSALTPTPATSTRTEWLNTGSSRELMNSGAPWVNYVNEVVFRDLKQSGVSIDPSYRISTGGLSALELLNLFKNSGWSWPVHWYRRNRNRNHSGGIHLEKEVENDRWLHLIIIPERNESTPESDGSDNWNLPPRRVDLHAENRWLQPSSAAHFCDFIKEHYILPFLRRFV